MIILEKGERADPLWGMDTEIITDEMIEALEQGKRLYLSVNDEYAVVIKKNGKRKTDKPEATDTDTISRRQAIDALDCINGVEEVLRALPSAQPQRIGHWVNGRRCSICGNYWDDYISGDIWYDGDPQFCPHCGARMEGDGLG